MHTVKEIIHKISELSEHDKKETYKLIQLEILHNSAMSLKQYRGLAKNLWNEDAQTYINKVRSNDRS